jgi:hypothetical protein
VNKFIIFTMYLMTIAVLCFVGSEGNSWFALFVFLLGIGGFFIFKKGKRSFNREKKQDSFYEQVAHEISLKDLKPDVMAKAAANSRGSKERAQSLYIEYRVEQLLREDEEGQKNENRRYWKPKLWLIFIALFCLIGVKYLIVPAFFKVKTYKLSEVSSNKEDNYAYLVFKQNMFDQDSQQKPFYVENIKRFYDSQACHQFLTQKQDQRGVEVECVGINDRIRTLLNFVPISETYCVVRIQKMYNWEELFIDIFNAQPESYVDGVLSGLQNTNATAQITCISPTGQRRSYKFPS